MSFSQDHAKRKGAAKKRATDACKLFESSHDQVYKNLDTDKQVKDADRTHLVDRWLGVSGPTAESLTTAYEGVCREKQQKGRRRPEARAHVLGHSLPRAKLEGHIRSADKKGAPVLGRVEEARAVVDHILKSPPHRQKKLMARAGLSDYQMWSHYDKAHPASPYEGIAPDKHELRRRLGLGHLDLATDTLLLVSHQLVDDMEPHFPTTFDSETNPHFVPGGHTVPLDGPRKDGFPEVVHDAISGSEIAALTEAL